MNILLNFALLIQTVALLAFSSQLPWSCLCECCNANNVCQSAKLIFQDCTLCNYLTCLTNAGVSRACGNAITANATCLISNSPTASPTMSPVHGCSPISKTKKTKCQKMIRTCGENYNIKLKWNGKSCPGVLGDSGCQCDQYCGYSCIHAGEHDKQCYWKDNQCYNKLTNQPGFPIAHCQTSAVVG